MSKAGEPHASDTALLEAALQRLARSKLSYRDALAQRGQALIGLFSEDYDGRVPSARSFSSLIDILEEQQQLPCPELTLTPAGDFFAEWRQAQRHASMEVKDGGQVRYTITWPNARHPHEIDRISISTTADSLSETIAPFSKLAA